MKICLLDPGLENNDGYPSSNFGDLIIQEAVNRELSDIFRKPQLIKISTQASLSREDFRLIKTCSMIFVGGTNLLSSNMDKYNQWKISLWDAFRIKNAVLLGVGWWQYQGSPNLYTRTLIKTALSNNFIHSVRDKYTKNKLEKLGINNVLNTGCPTMWTLSEIRDIPRTKSKNVLLMLTDYNKNVHLDRKLLEILVTNYEKIFFWPQGRGDREYILNFNFPVILLDRSLEDLDRFINSETSFDYIGTRLHGGIRCLCAKKRALILEVDNRAKEIAKDTNLPTVNRKELNYIKKWIHEGSETKINLDLEAIDKWKTQFLNHVGIF